MSKTYELRATTQMEIAVIKTFGEYLNYDLESDNIGDNCTCFFAKEVSKLTGIKMSSLRGVLVNLSKKGLIYAYDPDSCPMFFVTNDGIREYFHRFDSEHADDDCWEEESITPTYG